MLPFATSSLDGFGRATLRFRSYARTPSRTFSTMTAPPFPSSTGTTHLPDEALKHSRSLMH